ncbi:kinase-like protein [Cadophora sp. DSE1049]|nr:kinase-like protein [Cadophora sp. DSE1049]
MEESDKRARKEATIYEALGQHHYILPYLGLEISTVSRKGTTPMTWAIRLERAPHGCLRDYILKTATNPPKEQTRLELAVQFAEGVAHIHGCNVIWGDLSTRNALLFDNPRLKLCDFAESDLMDNYPRDWYGCEDRYCPPGSERPQFHDIGTMYCEVFALGTAIYEIVEWKVPYGPQATEDEVLDALVDGIWPQISSDNPAEGIIRRCWEYKYESSQQVVDDLKNLLCLRSITK